MMGLTNKDSSFFYVSSPDFPKTSALVGGSKSGASGVIRKSSSFFDDISSNVISFTIEEESNAIISGNIQLRDVNWTFADALRTGKRLEIAWGYKKPDILGKDIFAGLLIDQLKGTNERRGIKAYIQSASGTASSDGSRLFNLKFMGNEYLNVGKNKFWDRGTRETCVRDVLTALGVQSSNQFVKFKRGNDVLNENTALRMVKPPFAFLAQYSFEWRTVFKLGYNNKEQLIGLFAEYGYGDSEIKAFTLAQSQASGGTTVSVNYQSEMTKIPNNVISFSWSANLQGGDNVQIMLQPDGSRTFMRFHAQTETFDVYQLNESRLNEAIKANTKGSASQTAKFIQEGMGATKFSQVVKYFDLVKSQTAPQGLGYQLQLKMLGNPLFTSPCKIEFGDGFPAFCRASTKKIINFWIRKVTHTINRTGYFMDVDVADGYTISGGVQVG